jgi:hypothetical protein
VAVGLGGFGGALDPSSVAGRAVGQETETPDSAITTVAAVRDQEEFDQELTGFWIHMAAQLEPYEASVADQCAEIPWSDQEAMAFDAQLIDRQAEPRQSRVTVFLHDAVEVNSGDLFIVNEVTACEGPYTVLRLEQIGADAIGVGPSNEANSPTADGGGGVEPTGESGPGLGVLGTVAALLGGGWLAGRASDDE